MINRVMSSWPTIVLEISGQFEIQNGMIGQKKEQKKNGEKNLKDYPKLSKNRKK